MVKDFQPPSPAMTYIVSLRLVALVVGLAWIALHLPGTLWPDSVRNRALDLPRHRGLGTVLMLAATLWFTILTGVTDLGEISNIRVQLMAVWLVSGALVAIFVPTFLAARGLGCLLLLGAVVVLDAAFLVATPWRYVMTVTAYLWVVAGMALVYSPHYLRDTLEFVSATPLRFRRCNAAGVAFGLLLVILGLFVYP